MLQIFKKKVIWIPTVIVLSVAILIVIAWPAIQKATHKTYLEYETGVPNIGTFADSCQNAELIVRGTVVNVGKSFQKESGNVYTPVTIQVEKTYKGDNSIEQVTFYEQYGEYKNATWVYYSPKAAPQIPVKNGDNLIVHLRISEPLSKDSAAFTYFGSFASVSNSTVTLNHYVEDVQSLPGIGDDLTIPLSEFEALIADNL